MTGEDAAPHIKRYVIQVNPGRPRLGIDLTLCPKSILPDARNQRIEFTARIYAFKGGKWVYPGEKRKITFSFKEVSKEKGICMNFPKKDKSNTNPDLFFADDDDKMKDFDFDEDETDGDADKSCPTKILVADDNPAHSHHYKKATTKKAVTEAKVVVRCEDYGAFGILKAEAKDCEALKPRETDAASSQELGDNDVKIPRDDNGNNIADSAKSWDNVSLDKYGDGSNATANEDKDNTPATDNYKGDGLTNYEEYRGFIVGRKIINKRHRRTNINKKDVFIYDKNNLKAGFFSESGLIIHYIPVPDFYNGNSTDKDDDPPDAGTQVINFNRGYATNTDNKDQHGLRLVNENTGEAADAYGYTYGDGPGLPGVTVKVAINRDNCTDVGEHANQLKCTIAHELGHSVNLVHHGEEVYAGNVLQVHNHGGIKTEPAGRTTSGDVDCVMRYDNYECTQWCHPKVPGPGCCVHSIRATGSTEAPGTTFCDSQDGSGCNVSGSNSDGDACAFSNDAQVGNCKGHIRVKDW
ncbi:MAG: hypothetical protein OEW93_05140 [Candidatus Bathyarchaeota archaeon]|nr:hypothetical protein [Candidatus Bathyarchaeota archaeon]